MKIPCIGDGKLLSDLLLLLCAHFIAWGTGAVALPGTFIRVVSAVFWQFLTAPAVGGILHEDYLEGEYSFISSNRELPSDLSFCYRREHTKVCTLNNKTPPSSPKPSYLNEGSLNENADSLLSVTELHSHTCYTNRNFSAALCCVSKCKPQCP